MHNKKHFLLSFLFFVFVNHSSNIKSACTPLASTPGQTIWTLLDRAQKTLLGPITFFITSADLPITITEPGRYVLAGGRAIDSMLPVTSITTATDNVTIDLRGAGLRQNFNTASAIAAIDINGHSNITIMNGRFSFSSMSNTVGNDDSSFISFGSGGTAGNIILKDLNTLVNLPSEVRCVFGGPGVTVNGLLVANCEFISSSSFFEDAVTTTAIDFFDLNKGLFVDNFIKDNAVGLSVRGGSDIAIMNCVADNSFGTCFNVSGASNVFLYNCIARSRNIGFNVDASASNIQLLSCASRSVTCFITASLSHFINNCAAYPLLTAYSGAFSGVIFTPSQIATANFWESLSVL